MQRKRFANKFKHPLYHGLRKLLAMLVVFSFTCAVIANPVLDNIAAGSVSILQSTNNLTINQTSPKAIINWNSFNIGSQETTHFQQPIGGIILNRISPDQGVSQIYGHLTATGQIILINPAGIYFGPSAVVNVGGIIATTANIRNQDFLNGTYVFNKVGSYSGAIVNDGKIMADHGLVALVAPGVVNNGMIRANLGHVVLASGEAFTVSFSGDQLVNFAITKETTKPGVDKNGKVLRDGVKNTGSLIADGGTILVAAKAASGVLDNVINMQGVAQARSVGVHNGEIIFSGDPSGGTVKISGKIIATGKHHRQKGGTVKITGNQIQIDPTAVIDVSGDAGGGDIYIGGNSKGQGPLPNASAVVVAPNAQLLANAITTGNGGNIVVWANDVTKVYGSLSAKGGAQSGNGGSIETSGQYLDVTGINVNTTAPHGTTGQWLLDPSDLTISNSTTTNVGQSGGLFTANNNATTSNLSVADLLTELGLTNVTVQTTPGGSGAGSGNITVANNINWTNNNSLTLSAFNNIIINAGVTISNTVSGTAALTLQANNAAAFDIGAGGNVTNNGTINMAGPVNIFYNPASTNYLATPYTNAGAGTLTAFMLINNPSNLQSLSNSSAAWGAANNNFALNTNIDASSLVGFTPIGSSGTNFTGLFDGQNHTISNLTVNQPTGTDVGFFGACMGCTIKNLGLVNENITGQTNVGGLVGFAFAASTITNSFTTGSVSATVNGASDIGGLAGLLSTNVTNSYSTANVTASGTGNTDVGGFAGQTSTGSILSSFSTGTVTSGANSTEIGGFLGRNETSDVENTYSTGTVIAGINSDSVGGHTGVNRDFGILANNYSTGLVSAGAGSTNVGGFVGSNILFATVTNSFWDTQTSGQATSAAGTGETTANMMQQTTFCPAGNCAGDPNHFDFANNWGIINGTSYPYLLAFNPTPPRIFSGIAIGTSPGSQVVFAVNGNNLITVTPGSNGFYYAAAQSGANTAIPDNSGVLIYTVGTTSPSNLVTIAPLGNASLNNLSLLANRLQIGDNTNIETITNATLASAVGSLSNPNILYSASGNNITLGNSSNPTVNVITTTFNTTLGLNGNIDTRAGSTSNITLAGPVLLLTPSTISVTNNATFNNPIDGAFDLTINAGGTTALNQAVGGTTPLASLTVNDPNITISNDVSPAVVTTTGNQVYNGVVTLTLPTQFSGSTLQFNNGFIGGQDATFTSTNTNVSGAINANNLIFTDTNTNISGPLTANNVTFNDSNTSISGALSANNITMNGTGGSNSFSLASNTPQTWDITGPNVIQLANVSGVSTFALNNIQNITGGNAGNTFVFSNGASLTGLINGGSTSNTNTLNYLAYTTPISVILNPGVFTGNTFNSAHSLITNFTNINLLIGNGANNNSLTLPTKANTLTITGPQSGIINDPLVFTGFDTLISSSGLDTLLFSSPFTFNFLNQTALLGSTLMSFINFNFGAPFFDVASIIEQPDENSGNIGIEPNAPWIIQSDYVGQNIDDLLAEAQEYFDTNLNKVKINPYCKL